MAERKVINWPVPGRDQVIETDQGWDCIVGGYQYGTWRSQAEARGGMQVEQRRLMWRLIDVHTAIGLKRLQG